MVYIEKKNISNNDYYYHTLSVREKTRIKKYRRYIGSEIKLAQNKDEFYKSFIYFSNKNLLNVPPKINLKEITYDEKIINEIYKNNNLVYHFKEFNKDVDQIIEKEFPIKFIFNSNSIEGSRIPEEDVEKILKGKTTTYKNQNEVQEVKNSQKSWEFMKKGFKFNTKSIKELHKILTHNLKNNYGDPYVQGFKQVDIVVGPEAMRTASPKDVKPQLKKLLEWYKENKNKEFIPKIAFDFYYKYELIHPFEDGNGRTGRLIINKILFDNGYEPLIVFESNKESHHRAFVKAQNGHMKTFYDFMFKQYNKTFKEFYNTYIPEK